MAGALLAERGDGRRSPTSRTSTGPSTSTTGAGFPPAEPGSPCRVLLTAGEAERVVGRALRHPVVEPIPGQCAWPSLEGTPLDAELFLVVKEQAASELRPVLEATWDEAEFDLNVVDGVGDEAYFVVRREDGVVVSLDAYAGGVHVLLSNGGRDVFEGPQDAVSARLLEALGDVVSRLP